MDQITDALGLLDLMPHPAFCVRDGIIIKANAAAAACGIEADADVRGMLETGSDEYDEFQGGCLYLNLNIAGAILGASVTRHQDCDIFCLEQDADNRELQAMALASRELRKPLTSVMTTAQKLFPLSGINDDPAAQEQITRLNRGLFQMLRVIENMSDANRYAAADAARQELRDICAVLQEAFDKASAMVEHTGLTLEYEGFPTAVYTLTDSEKLEKAVYNIISNAIKFTPAGGSIRAKLTRRGNRLYLSICDSGSGIAENLRGSIFSRYSRPPCLEDGRFGIGLGMVLIRSAAALHGGAVLVDQPDDRGTRITMSLSIRTDSGDQVRSPQKNIDFTGGWDPCLVAFAESLPAELYIPPKKEK